MIAATMAVFAFGELGCDNAAPTDSSGPAALAQPEPSNWRIVRGSEVQALAQGEHDAALQAAIEQARRTADEARSRWLTARQSERGNWASNWAIKWAAPTLDGGIEHVWVRPTHWSEFRIEGVLDSQPLHQLECGRTRGEVVSLPIQELSDWIHAPQGDFARVEGREGGFTLAVLDRPSVR